MPPDIRPYEAFARRPVAMVGRSCPAYRLLDSLPSQAGAARCACPLLPRAVGATASAPLGRRRAGGWSRRTCGGRAPRAPADPPTASHPPALPVAGGQPAQAARDTRDFASVGSRSPPVIPEALEEFLRGIPGGTQDASGRALEPMAGRTQECQGQRRRGAPPLVPPAQAARPPGLSVAPDAQAHRHAEEPRTRLVRPAPGRLAQQPCRRLRPDRVLHAERAASHREPGASRQGQEGMPRPGALAPARPPIVGGAVTRVRQSGARGQARQIPQGHEVYPTWLRPSVFPPQGESRPVFRRLSTTA